MPEAQPTVARKALAWLVVVLMVAGVWKFVDYRNQPPTPPGPAASDQ
jgi:hypothetical protein